MKILLVFVILVCGFALEKRRKVFKTETIPLDEPLPTSIPNFIRIQDQPQQQIIYDSDSFTSERTQKLKTAQKIQDNSLKRAIQHSKKQLNFLQQKDEQQQSNEYPQIQMIVESNYIEQPQEDSFYRPIITDQNDQPEDGQFIDDAQKPNIEMPQ